MTVPEEVIQLISGSGNTFHAKVARWFQDNGWHVVVSPYYMDQTQGKAREIDLVAEKLWPVNDDFGHRKGEVVVRLFVECKFIPSHSVFWFADKDLQSAESMVCADGLFHSNNTYTRKHHYLAQSKRVAKIFATSVGKTQENEPYYKALNQVLNAMVSMRGQPVSLNELKKRDRVPTVLLEFPVVVCSSFAQIYGVDFFSDSTPELLTDNFQLEVRYAYVDRGGAARDDYFLLDFVEFQKLGSFVAAVDQDATTAAFFAE